MNKRLSLLGFLVLLGICANAQLTKTFHQSFEIDSIDHFNLNIEGDVTINYWAGNTILTKTEVEIYNASPNLFKHFVKVGRYDLEFLETGKNGTLKHKQLERKPIYTAGQECWEGIKLEIYIPDVFKEKSDIQFARNLPEKDVKS